MAKRRLDDAGPFGPFKYARLSSGVSPPKHELNMANCWDLPSSSLSALSTDRMLMAVFNELDASFNATLPENELAQLLGINPASSAPHLTRINLSFTSISDRFLVALGRHAPHLTSIQLDGCTKITDAGLLLLGQLCPQLISVSLSKCSSITDNGLAALASRLPQLQSLNLAHCPRISSAGLNVVANRCPLISVLKIGGTSADTAALTSLLSVFLLVDLDVSALPLTDTHLASLATSQPLLAKLNVSFCHELTSAGLRLILEEGLNLKELVGFGLAEHLQTMEDPRLNF